MTIVPRITTIGLIGLLVGQTDGVERLKKEENAKREPTEMSCAVAQHCIKRGTLETINGDTYYIVTLHGDWMARFYDTNNNKKLDADEKIEYFNPWDCRNQIYIDKGGNGIGPEDSFKTIINGNTYNWSLKNDPEVEKLADTLYHEALKPLFDFENTV